MHLSPLASQNLDEWRVRCTIGRCASSLSPLSPCWRQRSRWPRPPQSHGSCARLNRDAPKHVAVEFSEALDPKFSSLRLTNQGGAVVSKAASVSSADRKQMTLDLPMLPPGVYVVRWVSVATDGHRLEGNYKFTVK